MFLSASFLRKRDLCLESKVQEFVFLSLYNLMPVSHRKICFRLVFRNQIVCFINPTVCGPQNKPLYAVILLMFTMCTPHRLPFQHFLCFGECIGGKSNTRRVFPAPSGFTLDNVFILRYLIVSYLYITARYYC